MLKEIGGEGQEAPYWSFLSFLGRKGDEIETK